MFTMSTLVRVGAEWVQDFHAATCNQNNLSYRYQHTNDFCNQMRSRGHTVAFEFGDDNCWETDFRDPSFGSGGDSHNWTDNVHFMYWSDHGGNWGNNIYNIAFSKAQNQCISFSNTWKLGAKMLKWIVFDCCDCVLDLNTNNICAVWFPPSKGVHMVFGFVNLAYDSWWARNTGDDFGDDASQNHILSNAWLDAAYSWWAGNHPIAIAFGTTQVEAILRRDTECISNRDWNVTPNWLYWRART
jgi:hypothetical protein